MNGETQHPPAGRVVLLTRDRALVAREPSTAATVCTPTAYEAAAELLAGGVAVLVIDLRAFSGAHLRLLEIARESGAVLIATGTPRLPVVAQALTATPLTQRGDVPAAIERALASRGGATPAPLGAPSPIEVALAGPEGKMIDLSAAAWDTPPPIEIATPAPARPAQPPQGLYQSDRLPQTRNAPLLSQAELSALLEGPQ
ncbi:MAG: hypothetical protein ABFD92_19520 [Planctomycetaceae bacterium]|nr:hypothetical protein [Planctomycetaceae bacterium]